MSVLLMCTLDVFAMLKPCSS